MYLGDDCPPPRRFAVRASTILVWVSGSSNKGLRQSCGCVYVGGNAEVCPMGGWLEDGVLANGSLVDSIVQSICLLSVV